MGRISRWAVVLAFGTLLALPTAARAQFKYTTNADNTITITGYTGTVGLVEIPITVDGVTVNSIGNMAFRNCYALTNVSIPDSVTNIMDFAFDGCTNLTNVTMGNGVIGFGTGAFQLCRKLTGITLSDNVSSIGDYAFNYCSSLTNLAIRGNETGIGDHAFNGCTNLTNVTLGAGVTRIGNYSFYYCTRLRSVAMSNHVASIGDNAFDYCINLANVTIPGSVTNIGTQAFGWTILNGVYFQGNVPALGANAFHPAGATVTFYYLPGTAGWDTCGHSPIALWDPRALCDSTFGVQPNGFGFTVTSAGSPTIVVEACTNLVNAVWAPVSTNTLAGGSSYFGDPQWMNCPARFYRFRSP